MRRQSIKKIKRMQCPGCARELRKLDLYFVLRCICGFNITMRALKLRESRHERLR